MNPTGLGSLSLWSRVWPYLLAIACGLLTAIAVTAAIARWL